MAYLSDRLVGRQQADEEGGEPRGQQGPYQRHLTPVLVPQVTEVVVGLWGLR